MACRPSEAGADGYLGGVRCCVRSWPAEAAGTRWLPSSPGSSLRAFRSLPPDCPGPGVGAEALGVCFVGEEPLTFPPSGDGVRRWFDPRLETGIRLAFLTTRTLRP